MSTGIDFVTQKIEAAKGFDIVEALGYLRHASTVILKPIKRLFKDASIITSIEKNDQFIPSKDSLIFNKRDKEEVEKINDIFQKNQTDIYRFSKAQTFTEASRILRDYSLSIRDRKTRILNGVKTVVGISYLNDKYKRGEIG